MIEKPRVSVKRNLACYRCLHRQYRFVRCVPFALTAPAKLNIVSAHFCRRFSGSFLFGRASFQSAVLFRHVFLP